MVLLGLVLSFSLVSCFGSDDDDSNHSNDDNNGGASQIVMEGSWRVTLFQEDNSNQTNHFNGYVFTFNSNGSLIAVNGGTTQTGTWSTNGDDSSNKLWIAFPTAPDDSPFEEITEDWQIIAKTPSKIELKHVSGGDGSTDLLTFEKN